MVVFKSTNIADDVAIDAFDVPLVKLKIGLALNDSSSALLVELALCELLNPNVDKPENPAVEVFVTLAIRVAFSEPAPPLDKVNGVPITIAVALLKVGS